MQTRYQTVRELLAVDREVDGMDASSEYLQLEELLHLETRTSKSLLNGFLVFQKMFACLPCADGEGCLLENEQHH